MFVESFQGQYKDGTNGARDFRMVSALFLILRILILSLFVNQHRSTFHTAEMQAFLFFVLVTDIILGKTLLLLILHMILIFYMGTKWEVLFVYASTEK